MDLKRFYQVAKKELEALNGGEFVDFRLEQVERDEKNNLWDVVISYLVENKNRVDGSINTMASLPYERVYQRLIMDR